MSKLFFNSRDEVDVLFCSRFCESIVASIATGSDLLISFCVSAIRFLRGGGGRYRVYLVRSSRDALRYFVSAEIAVYFPHALQSPILSISDIICSRDGCKFRTNWKNREIEDMGEHENMRQKESNSK